jgi:hypothetical protein
MLINTLNKYIFILIISAILGMPWLFASYLIRLENTIDWLEVINYVNIIIKLLIAVLVLYDCKKLKLNPIFLIVVATVVYPLFGIVLMSLIIIEKSKDKACA